MLFQHRIDRAQKWLKERRGIQEDASRGDDDALPSMEELRREASEEMEVEKGDVLAMLLAAFITILPACLLALLIMVSVCLVTILL